MNRDQYNIFCEMKGKKLSTGGAPGGMQETS